MLMPLQAFFCVFFACVHGQLFLGAIHLLWIAGASAEQGSPQGANVSTSKGSATLLTWAVHRSFAYIRFRETNPCLHGRAENSQQTHWGSHWFHTELQAQERRMSTELCRGWLIAILCTMEPESFFEWDNHVKDYTRLSNAELLVDNDNELAEIKIKNKKYNGKPVVSKWQARAGGS